MLNKNLFNFYKKTGGDLIKVATNLGEHLPPKLGPSASSGFSLRNGKSVLRGPASSIVRPVEPFVKVDQKPSYLRNKKQKKETTEKSPKMEKENKKDALSYTSATK